MKCAGTKSVPGLDLNEVRFLFAPACEAQVVRELRVAWGKV